MFIAFSPKKDRNDLQHHWLCCMQTFQSLDSPKVVRTHIKISNSPSENWSATFSTSIRHTLLQKYIQQ